MRPIDSIELSGYLDGELDPARMREVEEALEKDPALRAQFAALVGMDAEWKATARSARFPPTIALPNHDAKARWAVSALGLTALIIVRLLPKFSDAMMWGVLLHSLALAALLIWIVRLAHDDAAPFSD